MIQYWNSISASCSVYWVCDMGKYAYYYTFPDLQVFKINIVCETFTFLSNVIYKLAPWSGHQLILVII